MKNLPSRPANDPFALLLSLYPTAFAPPPSGRTLPGPTAPKSLRGWLIDRIERWAWDARQQDLERALASSTDLADVERRLRAHERGVLNRYY